MGFRGSNGTSHKTFKKKGRWGKKVPVTPASKVVTYHISETDKMGSSGVKDTKRILQVSIKSDERDTINDKERE
ncbi:hypothetical protein ACFSR7_05925 [Cohnella sp. GCM10020058]|uniref:hypothetical protein n=1 Tax=Cohnella sp. GCM10020058 TaxID=3317330 RepID=UPI00363CE3F1